ncbi:MAG: hypothetical protein KG003_14530 [Bacteroidetes bacterium]|nr:hypothetical protein [Bacteroidota bacterium]
MLFDIGSYWTYKDSFGITDTVVVTGTNETGRSFGHSAGGWVSYQMTLSNHKRNEIYQSEVASHYWFLNWMDLFYSCEVPAQTWVTGSTYTDNWTKDSIYVEGKWYKNVRVSIISKNNKIDSGAQEYYYVADSIGVVRREFYNDHKLLNTRNLVSYDVKYHILKKNH